MVFKNNIENLKTSLKEVTRWEILRRSRIESPDRYKKKDNYSPKDFRNVDFEDLFENDVFTWSTRVHGEENYIVTISFEGPFEILKFNLKSMKGKNRWKRITLRMVFDALTKALDTEDLYFECSCPDFCYRFRYWATQLDCVHGVPQNTPPKVRNVKNNKGYCCKHILAILYGKRWVQSAAKAWLAYMRANPELTEFYIWNKTIKDEEEEENNNEDNNNDNKE